MKKTISILLALLIIVSMTACGSKENSETIPPSMDENFNAWPDSTPDEILEKFGKTFNLPVTEGVTYRYNIEVEMAEASYIVVIEEETTTPETSEPSDTTEPSDTETTPVVNDYKVVVRMKKMNEWHNILSDFGETMENAKAHTLATGIEGKTTSGEDPFGKYVAGIWFDEETEIVYAILIYNENGDLSIAKDIFTSKAD